MGNLSGIQRKIGGIKAVEKIQLGQIVLKNALYL